MREVNRSPVESFRDGSGRVAAANKGPQKFPRYFLTSKNTGRALTLHPLV